jgi:hypothetical protein
MEYVATAASLLSVVAGSFAAVIFGGYGIAQLIGEPVERDGVRGSSSDRTPIDRQKTEPQIFLRRRWSSHSPSWRRVQTGYPSCIPLAPISRRLEKFA